MLPSLFYHQRNYITQLLCQIFSCISNFYSKLCIFSWIIFRTCLSLPPYVIEQKISIYLAFFKNFNYCSYSLTKKLFNENSIQFTFSLSWTITIAVQLLTLLVSMTSLYKFEVFSVSNLVSKKAICLEARNSESPPLSFAQAIVWSNSWIWIRRVYIHNHILNSIK